MDPRTRRVTRTAVLAGVTALTTALAGAGVPGRAAAHDGEVSVTLREGTNFAVAAAPGGAVVMDLHNMLFRVPAGGGRARRLTNLLVEAARPDVAADGRITFQAYADGQYHIYTTGADGSGLRQLTQGRFDHREPRWSPDGRSVVFSSDRGGSYDIWSVEVATGALTRWTSAPGEEFEPTWHPDGAQVGYVAGDHIEAVTAAGAVRTIVPAVAGSTLNSPSWAPDGVRLAYVQRTGVRSDLMLASGTAPGTAVTTGQEVFPFTPDWVGGDELLYSADGKVRRTTVGSSAAIDLPFSVTISMPKLDYEHKKYDFDSRRTRQIQGVLTPALSPDGRQVAFVALNDLWLMRLGGRPQRITNDTYYETDPSWSRDGRYLAYSSDRAGTEDVYLRDLRTGQERRVTALPGAEVAAALSPDGTRIAFQDQVGATYVADVAGGAARQLVPSLFGPGRPTWSADGSTIAFAAVKRYSTRFREGTSQVLTVDVATGEQTFHHPGAEHASISTRGDDGPVWSPDGRSMALVVDSTLRVMPVTADGTPTGAARQVTNEAADAPTWSGDSARLLYLSNGRLRLADVASGTVRTVDVDLRYRPERPPALTVVHAGAFWDGESRGLRRNVDIVVVGNRIRLILPHSGRHAGGHVVDASGLTVMPGLWDAHVHREYASRFWGDRQGRLNLAFGITTTLSVGDQAYRAVEDRDATRAGERVAPRFFATGEPIDGSRVYYNFMRPTTSDAQIPLELSRARALDYDYLKTYVRLPADRMKTVIDAAHRMGVPSGSHYMTPGLLLGQDATTHLAATQRLGYARTMTATGASYADVPAIYGAGKRVVTTTLFTEETLYAGELTDDPRLALMPAWEREALLAGIADNTAPPSDPDCVTSACRQVRTFAAIAARGGTVVTGTDAPLDNPALGVHANLRMLVAHGWSAYDALRTATINPARYMGVSRDLGTLAPGKLADLIMVQGNPLERIEDALNVRMTIRNGAVFSTGELLRPFAGGDQGAGAVTTVGAATAAPSRYWWHAPEVVAADYADDCDTVADH